MSNPSDDRKYFSPLRNRDLVKFGSESPVIMDFARFHQGSSLEAPLGIFRVVANFHDTAANDSVSNIDHETSTQIGDPESL